jgi:hypothetical protein
MDRLIDRSIRFLPLVIVLLALAAATQSAYARGEQAAPGPATVSASLAAPVPFSSNGCSGFREATFFTCCFVHDFNYWAGGNRRERSAADHGLRRCVQDIGRDYIRSHIAFLLMRLSLGSGIFVDDGWGRAWRGLGRGRFTKLTLDQRRVVDEERKNVCQSLTLDSTTGRYTINARFIRETDHHNHPPREARELCGTDLAAR